MNDEQRHRLVCAIRDHLANVGCKFIDPRRLQDNLFYDTDEEVSELMRQTLEHARSECERVEPLKIQLGIIENYETFAAGLPIYPASHAANK